MFQIHISKFLLPNGKQMTESPCVVLTFKKSSTTDAFVQVILEE